MKSSQTLESLTNKLEGCFFYKPLEASNNMRLYGILDKMIERKDTPRIIDVIRETPGVPETTPVNLSAGNESRTVSNVYLILEGFRHLNRILI